MMKRALILLFLLAVASMTGCSQTRLSRRCPDANAYARVDVTRQGDIAIYPCPNRTLTINGIAQPKRYVALVSYDGTNPQATVLENTLGATITWAKSSDGVYTGTASSAVFTANKTLYGSGAVAYDTAIFGLVPTSTSAFQFICLSTPDGTPVNLARAVRVEIEVYQ